MTLRDDTMDGHRGQKRPPSPTEIEDALQNPKHARLTDEGLSSPPLTDPPPTPPPRESSTLLAQLVDPQTAAATCNATGSPKSLLAADTLFAPGVDFIDVPRPPNPFSWPQDAPLPTKPGDHAAWSKELTYKLPQWVFKCPFDFRPGRTCFSMQYASLC